MRNALTLVVLFLAFAIAGCASHMRREPLEAIEIDPKLDETARVDIDAVDILSLHCELERCAFEVFLRGDVVPDDSMTEVAIAVGTYDQVDAIRDVVLATKPVVHPEGMIVATALSTGVEDWGRAIRLDLPNGDNYAIIHGIDRRLSGKVEVDIRYATDESDLALVETAPREWRIARPAPAEEAAWPMGSGRDRIELPITDIFAERTAPTVALLRYGASADVSELVYYTCGGGEPIRYDRNTNGAMDVVSEDKASTTFQPSCRNWSPTGRLVVEVDYRDAYELELHVR
jgi:hypothetical protein